MTDWVSFRLGLPTPSHQVQAERWVRATLPSRARHVPRPRLTGVATPGGHLLSCQSLLHHFLHSALKVRSYHKVRLAKAGHKATF